MDVALAVQHALAMPELQKFKENLQVDRSVYTYYSPCYGILNLFTQKFVENAVKQRE